MGPGTLEIAPTIWAGTLPVGQQSISRFLDVACGAGARVNLRLEASPAIRALDQMTLHAAWGAAIRGYARVDCLPGMGRLIV